MTQDHDRHYFWCLRHSRVESGGDMCAGRYLLGPFTTETQAREALARVQERNAEWDSEDRRWRGIE